MNKPNPKTHAHLLDPLFDSHFFNIQQSLLCENIIELNYTSFKLRVRSLASKLHAANMNPQDRVAVALPRGLEAAIAIYAILYEGDVYVPLDVKNPGDRLAYIIKDAGVKIILGEDKKPEWCSDSIYWFNIAEKSEGITGDGKGQEFRGESLAAPSLRVILFAGEVFPPSQLLKLLSVLPHVKFYNLYRPTETNVCAFWPVDPKKVKSNDSIPIGFPACGNQLKVDSITEELLVSGPTLMSGYWQDGNVVKNAFDERGWV